MQICNLNPGDKVLMASDYYIVDQVTFVLDGKDRASLTPTDGGTGVTLWSDSPLLQRISISTTRT